MTDSHVQPLPPLSVSDDEFLLAFLDSHECPCPACGYNCHKIVSPRCPECGISLKLRFASLDAMRKSWGLAMIGASLAAGVGVLLLLLILKKGWPHGPFTREIAYRFTFSYFLGMIPGPIVLLVLRRHFERLPRPVRFVAASALLLLTTFMLLWLARVG